MPEIPADGLVDWVKSQIGKPYVWNADGPDSYDCSGLVTAAFRRYGVSLPHHAADQAGYGKAVAIGDIQPGDLVFSNWGRGKNSHVGIAVSSNQIINAPKPGSTVKYQTLTSGYRAHITAVRRLPQVVQGSGSVTSPTNNNAGGAGDGVGSALGQLAGQLGNGAGAPTNGGDGQAATGQGSSGGGGLLDKLADAIKTGLAPLAAVQQVGDKIIGAFLPTMIVRVICGVLGCVCVIAGLFFVFKKE